MVIEDLIKEKGLVSEEQLQEALSIKTRRGGSLPSILVSLKYVDKDEIGKLLSEYYGVPYIDLRKVSIPDSVLELVPDVICKKYTLIPFGVVGNKLKVAMSDPSNIFALEELRFATGKTIESYVDLDRYIKRLIEEKTGRTKLKGIADEDAFRDFEVGEEDGETAVDLDELTVGAEDAPIVKLVNTVLNDAVKKNASDIHFEPYEKMFRIRLRVDGILRDYLQPPVKIKNAVTSRIKILARLDIAERRLPQDGRINLRISNMEYDIRVSIIPTIYGEKAVLRLLRKTGGIITLEELGFDKESMEKYIKAISKPYGMILMTGPTGSGKSTTLYAALNRLNSPEVNIMTAEDPVEYNIVGVNQINIRESIGLTFASALRSFLRQDPDIIMVGEMRDYETAEVAVRAALTGHLVFSTLHTNDAPSTATRLINMGLEPFLVASSVNLIAAQRLIRRVCRGCSDTDNSVSDELLLSMGFKEEEIGTFIPVKGKGCDLCDGTGYKGRIALFETMEINEKIANLILRGATSYELKDAAIKEGMLTLRRSGLNKIREGITTVDEVIRVTLED
ncbi:MAG: type IV-A pilus assembly ATPase PilB [Deferribacterota bacterium]|nr:type IV-A pilus assembly ATPase PilB [Deferribacterota bacterium]